MRLLSERPLDPGMNTDIQLHEETCNVGQVDDYIVIRTPNVPEYFSGNMLILGQRPDAAQLPRFEQDFARLIGVPPVIGHRMFSWSEEAEGAVDLDTFVEQGYDATLCRSWVATPKQIRDARAHEAISVRTFNQAADWETWMQMQLADMPDPSDAVSVRCFEYQQKAYRGLIDRGLGDWWGAFIGHEQVASLGLFFLGRTGRFQSVITAETHRNRGICKTLVSEAIGREPARADQWVMVADESYHAGAIYQSLGFTPQGRIGSLCKVLA